MLKIDPVPQVLFVNLKARGPWILLPDPVPLTLFPKSNSLQLSQEALGLKIED